MPRCPSGSLSTIPTPGSLAFRLILLFLCLPAAADEDTAPRREGFRLGLELGAGAVERTLFDAEVDETNFYMGFVGGYWMGQHVLAGLELNGWLLQAGNLNDPSVGEGISRVFAYTQVYPSRQHGMFVKVGAGYVSYWNNRPGEPAAKDGNGFEIGLGYDVTRKGRGRPWQITPFVTYSSGKIGDERHKALTAGVGMFYQF